METKRAKNKFIFIALHVRDRSHLRKPSVLKKQAVLRMYRFNPRKSAVIQLYKKNIKARRRADIYLHQYKFGSSFHIKHVKVDPGRTIRRFKKTRGLFPNDGINNSPFRRNKDTLYATNIDRYNNRARAFFRVRVPC